MIHLKKVLFVILFVFKEIYSKHIPKNYLEHDITKRADNSIANLFNGADSDTVKNILLEGEKYILDEFKYNEEDKYNQSNQKVVFREVKFFVDDCLSPEIDWNFSQNKLHISIEYLFITVKGFLQTKWNEMYLLHTNLSFINATIDIIGSPNNPSDPKYSISQDSYAIELESRHLQSDSDGNESTSEDKIRKLGPIILETLPLMLTECLNKYGIFDSIYKCYSESKTQIISMYPNFVKNEQKFYYLIPRFPFHCFYFKMVMIRGLTNFETIKVYHKQNTYSHTLLIKKVEGKLELDYGTEDESSLPLIFEIYYLTISINKESKILDVKAQYYYVNRTTRPLTYRQSTMIMQGIESAIADSIMPSMKIERRSNIKLLEQQIQITPTPDWELMRTLYEEWIPFNEGKSRNKNKS